MNSVINESNLKVADELGQNYATQDDFNCWGATLFVLAKIRILKWSSCREITEFIKDDTFKVKDKKKGDILVLYQFNKIVHTAVYVTKNKLFHKRGLNKSEFDTECGVKAIYDEHDKFEIRRLK